MDDICLHVLRPKGIVYNNSQAVLFYQCRVCDAEIELRRNLKSLLGSKKKGGKTHGEKPGA